MTITNGLSITRAVKGILLAYPVLLLTVKGGMSASFIILLAFAIYIMFRLGKDAVRKAVDHDLILFSIAMAATFVSVMLSQLYHMQFDASALDSPLRFMLAPLIFIALRSMGGKSIGIMQYGFLVGAILIGVLILATGQQMAAHSYFLIHIHLGDLALMLGFLSVLSINWTQKDNRWLIGLKVIAMLAGLYVSLASGARGGWAAIPVFVLAWVLTSPSFKKGLIFKLSALVAVFALGAALSYVVVERVHVRVDAAISDLRSVTPDTSLGIRFQLWGAATHAFLENPVFGVGSDGFTAVMDKLEVSGAITTLAGETGKGEVHSYYFATLARYGLVGLVALGTLFLVPLWLFLKARSSSADFNRISARMGLAVVLGFMVYCVTVEMFNLKMVATFYAMTVAVLLAAVFNRKVEAVN